MNSETERQGIRNYLREGTSVFLNPGEKAALIHSLYEKAISVAVKIHVEDGRSGKGYYVRWKTVNRVPCANCTLDIYQGDQVTEVIEILSIPETHTEGMQLPAKFIGYKHLQCPKERAPVWDPRLSGRSDI